MNVERDGSEDLVLLFDLAYIEQACYQLSHLGFENGRLPEEATFIHQTVCAECRAKFFVEKHGKIDSVSFLDS